jgi:hypothetical protein
LAFIDWREELMLRVRLVGRVAAGLLVASMQNGTANADVVTDWNVVALTATAVPPNSIVQSRSLAIVHAAIHDAVQAIEQKGAYLVELKANAGASVEAAVAAAAHTALVRLAPAQRAMLDTTLQSTLSKIAEGQAKIDGVNIGTQVAEEVLRVRGADGSDAKIAFTAGSAAGYYQPTPPHLMAPILTQWPGVRPFVLRDRNGLEFKGPPAVGSKAFARDFEEVKRLGARNSTARTGDQTAAAIFWTVQTAVPWHAAARAISAAKALSVADNARMFAVLSLATADSQIVAFEEKYKHPHWRPITAIRAGNADARLKAEPNWEPLVGTPPHPEYPSAHSVFSGAAEAVLRDFLQGDRVDVTVTVPPVFGITRTYTRLSQITDEVEGARVWGGIHFRSADRDGVEIGRKIGAIVSSELAARFTH